MTTDVIISVRDLEKHFNGGYIPSTYSGVAFLIRTYVTDGTYNYDLYRNGSRIAANLSTTTHNDNNLAYGTYNYYVYWGESFHSQ